MDEPPPRASSRAKKTTERYDSYSKQIGECDNSGEDEEELFEVEEKPEKFEDPIEKIDWAEMEGEGEKDVGSAILDPPTAKVKKTRRKSEKVRNRQNFTIEERRRVFQHVLDECRSKVPGREGRIAKYKVQTANGWVWEKFKEKYGYDRDMAVYRIHYDYYAKKLHTVPGLTLDERVDLYYAMDIPITDPEEKATIIEKYGATVDEKNIITGSTVCTHWDLEHSASEEEEEDGDEDSQFIRDTTRYVEYHDGAMWQYIVDMANSTPEGVNYGYSTWQEFKRQHRTSILTKKSTMGLMVRFKKIQLPNLHIMPFDIETKAALYETLGYPVPVEFRDELTAATGVILTSYGYVEEYPNRPAHLVLQSKLYPDSKIKLSSTTRFSMLKEPADRQILQEDRRPWTIQEDREIWQHIRAMATKQPYGVVRKLHIPKSGQNFFWWKFSEQMQMERGCIEMAKNFKRLRANILSSEYDLKTKIELFYVVSQPLEEDAVVQFKTISILVLNENRTIRYAIGEDWMVGRSADAGTKDDDIFTFHYDDEQYRQILKLEDGEIEPDPNIPSTSSAPPPLQFDLSTVSYQIMEHVYRFEAAEKVVFESISRSQRFPYVDYYHRSKLFQKRQRHMIREGVCEPPPAKEPKIEHEGSETEIKQKMEDSEKEVESELVEGYELQVAQEDEEELIEEQYYVDDMVEVEVGRPPVRSPQLATSVVSHRAMEYAFDELQKIYDVFHQTLRDGSRYLDASQLNVFRAEIERLANSFRQSAKSALTDDGDPKKQYR